MNQSTHHTIRNVHENSPGVQIESFKNMCWMILGNACAQICSVYASYVVVNREIKIFSDLFACKPLNNERIETTKVGIFFIIYFHLLSLYLYMSL